MQSSARQDQLTHWVKLALLILLIPLAAASLLRGMNKASQTICDYEQFWVSGVLVRQGMNPYRVFLEERQMLLDDYAFPYDPDFTCADPLPDRPNYNTPLLALLMVPFSWLDFYTSKMIWAALQVVMAIALPLVMLRLNWREPGRMWQAIAVLLLLAWAPTRTTFAHGQVALLSSLALMLSVVLARRGLPIVAGILLGLAVSKYTLTGAVLVFFIAYRYYRVLGVALLTQLLGLLGLAPLVGETPLQIIGSYFSLLQNVVGQSYEIVSLDGWLNIFGVSPLLSALIAFGLGAIIVLTLVLPQFVGEARGAAGDQSPAYRRVKGNLLIVTMVLVGLLFVYHRMYDLPIAFVYITFLMGASLPDTLHSRAGHVYAALAGAGLLLTGAVIVPPSAPSLFFDEPLSYVIAAIPITLSLLLALGASILALHRLDDVLWLFERGPALAPVERAPDGALDMESQA